MGDIIYHFDNGVFQFIKENLMSPFMDALMVASTKLGDGGLIWIIIGIALLFAKKHRKTVIMMGIAIGLSCLCSEFLIKLLIQRPRPFAVNPNFHLLIPEPHGPFSFPSSHTATSFAACIVLVLNNRKFAWTYIFAFLVAFSRIYLYVHYLTDVLSGLILGTLIGFIVCFLYRNIESKFRLRKMD